MNKEYIPEVSPLYDSQLGIYTECLQDPESTMYNVAFGLPLPKGVDLDRFSDAVIATVNLHPSFFVTIDEDEGTPFMRYKKSEVKVLRTKASGENYYAEFIKPFDFKKGPLYRFEIVEISGRFVFLFDIHHIIFDGTSVGLFFEQIAKAYDGMELPAENHTFFEIINNSRDLKSTPEYKASIDFFRKKFEDFDAQMSIQNDVVPAKRVSEVCERVFPDSLGVDRIKAFADKRNTKENLLFNAVFSYTLSLFTGEESVYYNTVTAGRYKKDIENTVGMFVRTLPMYFKINTDAEIDTYLKEMNEEYYEAIKHDNVSFGDLAKEFGLAMGTSFIYQGELLSEISIAGEKVMPQEPPFPSPADLLFMVMKLNSGYKLRAFYKPDLYSKQLIDSIMDTFLRVCEGFLTEEKISDINPVSDLAEAFIDEFNSTSKPFGFNENVNDILEKTLVKYPEHTAVVFNNNITTYSDFDKITKKIAAYVTAKGIGEDEFVAILMDRSDKFVLSAWGVIRSGAAFEPLDPTYPSQRLDYMVADSGTRLVIADRKYIDLLPGYKGDVLFADELEKIDTADDFACVSNPSAAITMIYTSGTTGVPKGSVLENRNLAAFYHNHKENMGIDENSRVANYASFGFDAGTMDIVSTILCGAALYIVPDEIRLDINAIDKFFIENQITHAFMTTQVGRMFALQTECKSLAALLVGGEKLVPFMPTGNFRFINGYGPCETFAYVCHHCVTDDASVSPIGKPSGNTKLYVVSKVGKLLPPGAVGEMCISGCQVGRGYLGLPEKTSESFVSNPFSNEPGYERMYKTGDIVRLLPTGELEYIGRKDGQVKIRGYRVELTEVEEAIRKYDKITDATVCAFNDNSGGKYIAAYVVSKSKVDIEQLKSFIRASKPDYMVPAAIMQLDAIPYTQNQKVNKRALPVLQITSSKEEKILPKTDFEKEVFDIVAKVLGHSDFGVNTDFFEAGLTSIGILKLNAVLAKQFGKEFRISEIKENPNVTLLCGLISEKTSDASKTEYEKRDNYPLKANQEGIYIASVSNPSGLEYNIPVLIKLSADTDLSRLKAAIKKAADAHPMIKATLSVSPSGEASLLRNDCADVCIEEINVPGVIADNPALGKEKLCRAFDILSENLCRFNLVTDDKYRYLFIEVHHIIADGTSLKILLSDINSAYENESVVSETFTGFENCLDDEKAVSSERYPISERYWDELLKGCNTDCAFNGCPNEDGNFLGEFELSFEDGESKMISDFCEENHLGKNAFFNSAFSYVMSEYIGNDDITYCTVYNGRNDSTLENVFSMLVKTLPVRVSLDKEMKVSDYIGNIGKQLLNSMAEDIVPFTALSKKYSLKPDIFFNYQGDDFDFKNMDGAFKEQILLPSLAAKSPISFEVFLSGDKFRIHTVYDGRHYSEEFARGITDSIITAAVNLTKEQALKDVEICSEKGKAFYSELNDTNVPIRNIFAQELFEKAAEENPDKIAVRTSEKELTYKEVNGLADLISYNISKMPLKEDEIIGIILDRSVIVPVCELGILKAGAAFLPMLPTYPAERIAYCIKDAGVRYVICDDALFENDGLAELCGLCEGTRFFTTTELLKEPDGINKEAESGACQVLKNEEANLDRLAYCIYTSGSTGTPKGVMITQRNFTNFLQTSLLAETVKLGNVILCMASISFDMSITEMFTSLSCGNTIYIAKESEIHNLDELMNAFTTNNVDVMMMTPSLMSSLITEKSFEKTLSNLRAVALGAERFLPSLFDKLKLLNANMQIINGYGPTECTQVCTAKIIENGDKITIGKPFSNVGVFVMNNNSVILPRFAVGEMVIVGDCVSRGYVNLPEKNAESFITVNGIRGYRSGDLVYINSDNEIEYIGRKDNQVKLRGFRVELGEIEAVMNSYPGVISSKVVVRNNKSEDYLAAFFTANEKVDVSDMSVYLKSKLTYYMVPAGIMQIDSMPLTPNGKVDEKSLPEIALVKKERMKRAPKKSVEEYIIDVFKEVLSVNEIYADDNFFEIGGTSLTASKAVMQLKSKGYKIEYQDIFDHQSAEELGEYLENQNVTVNKSVEEHIKDISFEGDDEEEYIRETLKFNTMEHAGEVKHTPIGNVLLTGSTGFLGNHILKELIDNEEGHIFCLMRKGNFSELKTRLQTTLVYYFDDDCNDTFDERITLIEGDVTDDNLSEILKGCDFDTIINCAALVKHFANDNSIEFVNVHGVENLIEVAKEKNAKLIQISTTSIPGAHDERTYKLNLTMPENKLFVVDDMNNQYIQSKYHAELKMLKAISEGMRGKIIRVGNLMGRYSDGEFQTNMRTNAFLNGMKGFAAMGKCPLSHSTDPMSFSPVDCSARAVILLAGTNDCFTVFNAESRSHFDEMMVINALNNCGIKVTPVDDNEYYEDFYRMMGDDKMNGKISALLTNDRPDMHMINTENRFTANVLYRLGFNWPFIEDRYLERLIESLNSLGFFKL